MRASLRVCLCIAALATPPAATAARAANDFEPWLAELRREASERGISQQTLDAALGEIAPLPRVIELDRTQPESGPDFCDYLSRRVTATRIQRGKQLMAEEVGLLRSLTASYGVPYRYLVALWGLETNFGNATGDYPVIASLATLAHDARRPELFRRQLLAALRIIDDGHQTPAGYVGSWAGATGQVQFMPTTFLEYAVDRDGDGRKDLWKSRADALASAANYLRRSGWRRGETWGRAVRLPAALETDAAALARRRPLGEWAALGVTRASGASLPKASIRGRIVLPRGSGGPAYLAYANYETFLEWNRSTFFAVSVGVLADALVGRGPQRPCGG